jgi:hypothetical protein
MKSSTLSYLCSIGNKKRLFLINKKTLQHTAEEFFLCNVLSISRTIVIPKLTNDISIYIAYYSNFKELPAPSASISRTKVIPKLTNDISICIAYYSNFKELPAPSASISRTIVIPKELPAPLKITAWTLLFYGEKRGLFAVRGVIFFYNAIPHKFRSTVKQKVSSSGKAFLTEGCRKAAPEQRRG